MLSFVLRLHFDCNRTERASVRCLIRYFFDALYAESKCLQLKKDLILLFEWSDLSLWMIWSFALNDLIFHSEWPGSSLWMIWFFSLNDLILHSEWSDPSLWMIWSFTLNNLILRSEWSDPFLWMIWSFTLNDLIFHSEWSDSSLWMIWFFSLNDLILHSEWSDPSLWMIWSFTPNDLIFHSEWSDPSLWMIWSFTLNDLILHSEWCKSIHPLSRLATECIPLIVFLAAWFKLCMKYKVFSVKQLSSFNANDSILYGVWRQWTLLFLCLNVIVCAIVSGVVNKLSARTCDFSVFIVMQSKVADGLILLFGIW